MAQATPTDLAPFNAKLAAQNVRDNRGSVPLTPLRGSTEPGSRATPGVVVTRGGLAKPFYPFR